MTPEAEIMQTTWQTPGGHAATFEYRYRPETTDWNTISSILVNPVNAEDGDEYGIRGLQLEGWAIDVGAHIGGMAIALALDNPGLRVIAIEPVPDNVRLLRLNVALNGLDDRITILEGSADAPGTKSTQVAWNWNDGEGGTNTGHRFIGGSHLAMDHGVPHDEVSVPAYNIASLATLVGTERFSFLKIDCEGCETKFLKTPAVKRIDRIAGEWHPPAMTPEMLDTFLGKTHTLDIRGIPGPGAFLAVRKGVST